MNFIQKTALILLLAPLFPSLLRAETLPVKRQYGLGFSLEAGRSWIERYNHSDSLVTGGSLLFLQQHFHFGPALGYTRVHSADYSYTLWSLGAVGKWTYENLQVAQQTPFITVSGFYRHADYNRSKINSKYLEANVGYEIFLNPFVSFAPSIRWQKERSDAEKEEFRAALDTAQASAGLRMNLNVYL